MFIGFQSDLLRKHYVAGDQRSLGYKTPADYRAVFFADFNDIRCPAVTDAVSLPGVAADNVEPFVGIELRTLLRQQPFSQEHRAAGLAIVLAG